MSGKGGLEKYGAMKFWRKGILPPYRRALADHADKIIEAISIDLGGEVTATQGVLLGQLRKLLIFQALIDAWLAKQKDFVNAKGELPPALSGFYLAALNQSCRIVKDLGLERKAPADNLEAYLKAKASSAAAAETTKPLTKRARQKRSSIVEASGEAKENE